MLLSMCVVCSVSVCVQSVRSYENKAAGVFVSGFDPTSPVSLSSCICLCLCLCLSVCHLVLSPSIISNSHGV